jgi:hypothetical protein
MNKIRHAMSPCGFTDAAAFWLKGGAGYLLFKPAEMASEADAAVKRPSPCIENTAAMNAPRVLVLEYSDMIVADKG